MSEAAAGNGSTFLTEAKTTMQQQQQQQQQSINQIQVLSNNEDGNPVDMNQSEIKGPT